MTNDATSSTTGTRSDDLLLQFIFSNVNDWLKFGEAKNGAIFTFDSALMVAMLSAYPLDKLRPLSSYVHVCLTLALLFLVASAFFSLLSFLPKLSIPVSSDETIRADDNILYFGHLKNYTPDGLLVRLEIDSGNQTKLQRDFAVQIVTNSQIAWRKYRHFSISAWLLLGALLSPLLSAAICAIVALIE